MEKIDRYNAKSYPALRLYQDDLEAIVALFERKEPDRFAIAREGRRYLNLQELLDDKKNSVLNELTFEFLKDEPSSRWPTTIALDVTRQCGTSIHASVDTDLVRAIVSELEELIKPRERFSFGRLQRIPSRWAFVFVLLVSFCALFILRDMFSLSTAGNIAAFLVCWNLLWLSYKKFSAFNLRSLIFLGETKRHEGFGAEANGRRILIATGIAVGALLGIIGTILALWFLGRFGPPKP
ncbi:MAG: hypothetical protein HY801_09540 [Candidatus Lindowbacteria bacterium]|nr:hypothetical protein [Candidatus Lindowbacteria bacterium]